MAPRLLVVLVIILFTMALFFGVRWLARLGLRNRPGHLFASKITAIPLAPSGAAQSSIVLQPRTQLLALAGFVPPGFKCGVEVLNDNTTPMEFVVSTLSANLGLSRKEATRTMITIHEKGGALLPTANRAQADAVAQAITAAAANLKYPLVCRAVSVT